MKLKNNVMTALFLLFFTSTCLYFYVKKSPTDVQNLIDVKNPVSSENSAIKSEQHLFKPLSKTVFTSKKERMDLFTELDIQYLDATIVTYNEIKNYDPKDTDKYRVNPQFFETLHELYADDIDRHFLAPISLRWLGKTIGHGIFAETDFSIGDFIGEYTGVIENRTLVHDKDYAWSYPITTLDGTRSILDAKYKGNELRFINDGLEPNCQVQYLIGNDNLWHVIYIASKDIKKGEQLLVSYGPAYWESRNYGYQELAVQ